MSITLSTVSILLLVCQMYPQTSIRYCDSPSLSTPVFAVMTLIRRLTKQPQRNNNVLLLMAIVMSGDVQLNPGPRDTNKNIFPCGICEHPVTWNCVGVACDDCGVCFYKTCIDMCSKD